MEKIAKPEVWLRGPLPEIPALLQPVAHALLQAEEEVAALADEFPDKLLWEKPSGVASVGFHLQHITGVLDRLFTYAASEQLSEMQLHYLKNETREPQPGCTYADLLARLHEQIVKSLDVLKTTQERELTEIRYVGRAKIASTQLGLLFHAAEHTQRHTGQLLVTARIVIAAQEH